MSSHSHSHEHDHGDHHHHSHDHSPAHGQDRAAGHSTVNPSPDDLQKLKTVLSYLAKHNEEHIVDLEKWIFLSESVRRDDVAKELVEVISLSEHINEHIENAIAILNEGGQ